jgi:Protein of unknown function (DUF2637)
VSFADDRAVPPGGISADPPGVEPLGTGWLTVTVLVGIMAALIALGGMVLSFRAVSHEMIPAFGARWAWLVPVVVDLTVFVFSGVDLVLARLDMSHPLARITVYVATGGTIYLNYSAGGSAAGRVAHVLMPSIWVVFIELMRHVVRRQVNLVTASHREPIPTARWLLSPWPTLKLWRRMVLWRVNSYPAALVQEKGRLGAVATARELHGRLWRWRISPLTRLQINLGEMDAYKIRHPVVAGERPASAGPAAWAGAPASAAPVFVPSPAAAEEDFERPVRRHGAGPQAGPAQNGHAPSPQAPSARIQTPHPAMSVADLMAPVNGHGSASAGPAAAAGAAGIHHAAPPTDQVGAVHSRHAAPANVTGSNVPSSNATSSNISGSTAAYHPIASQVGPPPTTPYPAPSSERTQPGTAQPAAAQNSARPPAHVLPAQRGPLPNAPTFQAPPPALRETEDPAMPPSAAAFAPGALDPNGIDPAGIGATGLGQVGGTQPGVGQQSELLVAAREVDRWRGQPSANRIGRELGVGPKLAAALADALRAEDERSYR